MFHSLMRQVVYGACRNGSRIRGTQACGIPTIQTRNVISPRSIIPLKFDKEFLEKEVPNVPEHFRHVYPDFIPEPTFEYRNRLKERIEREDMLGRRAVMDIPEFYAGSILAVTVSDANASGKTNRFVGICMVRGGHGLLSWFILRNIVDNLGVEILYEMYCPLLVSIEVLRLEKRLDDDLSYLRDCLPEFSTFPFNLEAEPVVDGAPVPVNTTKCILKPRPWHSRWERFHFKGLEMPKQPLKYIVGIEKNAKPWEKYDLMKEYRNSIPEEEQALIYRELKPHMPKLEASRRKRMKISIFKDKN